LNEVSLGLVERGFAVAFEMLAQQAVELDIGFHLDFIDHPEQALGLGHRIGGCAVLERQPELAGDRR
jgi:hypothetical protein